MLAVTKVCRCCGLTKPLTSQYWHTEKTGQDGFRANCKDCKNKQRADKYWNEEKFSDAFKKRTRAYSKERYEREGEKLREQSKIYHAKPEIKEKRYQRDQVRREQDIDFVEANKTRCKVWYEQNKERHAAYREQWKTRNFERFKEAEQKYSARTREKKKIYITSWRAKNIEKVRISDNARYSKRRALLAGAEGTHSYADVVLILKKQHFICHYCRCDISGGKHTVDHYIPLAKGGSNWPSNLVMACKRCNFSKSDKMPEEFINYLARYASSQLR